MTDVERQVGRASRALWRRAGTEVLATLPDEAEVKRLGGSAAAVWVLLDEPRSVADLVRELGDAYDVRPEEILEPVAGCVDELVAVGLVEEVPGA